MRAAAAAVASRPSLAALGFVAFALLVRGYDFGNPIVHVDEEWYLLVGDRLSHGARLYLDLWDRKPLGLFAIYAAIRLLPGDGILAYQLCACLFAAATGWVIWRAARLTGAAPRGAWLAGAAYILWLSLFSGRGGQAPVFYNLFVAGAACLTLRLPGLAARRAVESIVANGAAACALAGLAIQTKYTPAIEGAFFGLAHLHFLRRAGARWPFVGLAATLWAALGVLPTALAALYFAVGGPDAWAAFCFANFTSIALRRGYPAAKIVGRLAGIGAQLLPLVLCAALAWREARPARPLLFGWLTAALIAFAVIGAFFDHYALPLLVPLAVIAAGPLGQRRWLGAGVMLCGTALLAFHLIEKPNRDGAGVRRMAAAMTGAAGCPYVFAGDSVLYLLGHACVPTAYAFPSSLAYEPERGAIGIDEAAEVRRIMAGRPPFVVTLAEPLAPWNKASIAIVDAALRDDYRLVMRVPRQEGGALLLYRRRSAGLTVRRNSRDSASTE